jgi:hypothetical protein
MEKDTNDKRIAKIKRDTIKQMKELLIYKKSFDPIIEIYAGLMHQYEVLNFQFKKSNFKITDEYTNKAGATNERKTPVYMALEGLRKDILSYSDKLGLNPAGLNRINDELTKKKKVSKLEKALSNING